MSHINGPDIQIIKIKLKKLCTLFFMSIMLKIIPLRRHCWLLYVFQSDLKYFCIVPPFFPLHLGTNYWQMWTAVRTAAPFQIASAPLS